jgi:Sigma-70, region 4
LSHFITKQILADDLPQHLTRLADVTNRKITHRVNLHMALGTWPVRDCPECKAEFRNAVMHAQRVPEGMHPPWAFLKMDYGENGASPNPKLPPGVKRPGPMALLLTAFGGDDDCAKSAWIAIGKDPDIVGVACEWAVSKYKAGMTPAYVYTSVENFLSDTNRAESMDSFARTVNEDGTREWVSKISVLAADPQSVDDDNDTFCSTVFDRDTFRTWMATEAFGGNEMPPPEWLDWFATTAIPAWLGQLSPLHRAIAESRLLDGLTQREVAEELDVSVGTVKYGENKAKAKFKDMFGDSQ